MSTRAAGWKGCLMERVPDGKQIGLKLVCLNNYLMKEESY